MMLSKMSRVDMEVAILEHDIITDLDKARKMTDEEMRKEIQQWIEAGDETAENVV
jgi:hypothetical protein